MSWLRAKLRVARGFAHVHEWSQSRAVLTDHNLAEVWRPREGHVVYKLLWPHHVEFHEVKQRGAAGDVA
jgi:hypothetical protein